MLAREAWLKEAIGKDKEIARLLIMLERGEIDPQEFARLYRRNSAINTETLDRDPETGKFILTQEWLDLNSRVLQEVRVSMMNLLHLDSRLNLAFRNIFTLTRDTEPEIIIDSFWPTFFDQMGRDLEVLPNLNAYLDLYLTSPQGRHPRQVPFYLEGGILGLWIAKIALGAVRVGDLLYTDKGSFHQLLPVSPSPEEPSTEEGVNAQAIQAVEVWKRFEELYTRDAEDSITVLRETDWT